MFNCRTFDGLVHRYIDTCAIFWDGINDLPTTAAGTITLTTDLVTCLACVGYMGTPEAATETAPP